MKVLAWYYDGSFREVPLDGDYGCSEAIELAKKQVPDLEDVERWEVEEDFL